MQQQYLYHHWVQPRFHLFSSSLFLSDYFTLNDRAAWSRDRVLQKIAEIAGGQDPKERHIKLVEDFERESILEDAATRKVWEELLH
mgnify:CR=1 FL=1